MLKKGWKAYMVTHKGRKCIGSCAYTHMVVCNRHIEGIDNGYKAYGHIQGTQSIIHMHIHTAIGSERHRRNMQRIKSIQGHIKRMQSIGSYTHTHRAECNIQGIGHIQGI